ncbi:hypothetical protein MTR67_018378 [Solanum verrucosum]|uniref:Uncharacterized protein n=1 Tax=Solanum verrucosum TaxID=315347 RepID=A0AAF0QMD5_SOLVR|nr:hypothetical protein MTR67_018378 [Solanum verrucosum]
MGEYRPVQSDLKIPFLRITAIQNLEDDTVRIPIMVSSVFSKTLFIQGSITTTSYQDNCLRVTGFRLELQYKGKTQTGRYTTTTCPEYRSSHTYDSKKNVGDGEGTSSSSIKVYARKLKKRRKFLIDKRDSDEDTNKNVNLKA